ncbi:hypothetical protein C1645_734298 [Glomus cerebriforme]|uniref:Reelin domain-containing protein n=1 Tax=Glomus cerebriforme TaxID=658196 RepID=A0A397TJU1_9GLOM|nr:hypothetical protein C1645_734298 [Glomus cerebriforme]
MTKYLRSFPSFILIIIALIFFAIITSEAKPNVCRKLAHVEFLPEFNIDNLYGVIKFTETSKQNNVIVDGIFTSVIGGVDAIIAEDGQSRYTAELYDKKGRKLYDLTQPVFHNAMELVSFEKQYANLTICNGNSIIGKVVIIKRDGDEIAKAEVYELL